MAGEGDRRSGLEVEEARSSKILGGLGSSKDGRRGVVVALVSTVVFLVAIGVLITQAPGWQEVKILTAADYDAVVGSGKLFARKLDAAVDERLMDMLDDHAR